MATTVTPPAPLARPEALPMELARALGDPLRWRIVELLAAEQLCVAHLAEELQTAQPLVSHHLKVLRAAGLVETDRYRYWTYYRLRLPAPARGPGPPGCHARAGCRRCPEWDRLPPPDPRRRPHRARRCPLCRAPRRQAHALPRHPDGPAHPPDLHPLHRGAGRGVPRHLLAGDHRTL
ncbi:MAG TPA: metalloregulator ArsR/SmtB family transcription factor, partial [Actinomycetota bacterium]|nr:metalloregulator ArsR/SmtB family transcription factor [Actinomycetota bacterium]